MPILTITETLFGGLIIAWVLFYLARKSSLSVFWSSIMSAALPFIAYLFYANQHWAGGDVLAIHVAVLISNAGLLMVFAKPQKEKMHLFPKLIIAFFFALAVLNASLLSIASKGLPDNIAKFLLPNVDDDEPVHTGFPGVVQHDKNKSYQPHLQRINAQQALGWHIEWLDKKKLIVGLPQTIAVQLLDANNQPIQNAKVTMELLRFANQADDQTVSMQAQKPGEYQAELLLSQPGRWQITITAEREKDFFQTSKMIFTE